MSEVIVFEPRESSVEVDRDTLIVTTNHLGADMRGDAGLDAQYLADISGHRVAGLNRIGSGYGVHYSKPLAQRLTRTPESVTAEWHETLEPELRRQAPSRVELVGRSAGANLLLHVAALEIIPEADSILAIEALRLQRINTHYGQVKYAHYQLRKEGAFRAAIDTIVDMDLHPSKDERSPEASNILSMIKRQLIEIRHYQHMWASDLPMKNALLIAREDKMAASFVFAEKSMAAGPARLGELLHKIREERKTGSTHPLTTEVVPRTTHGSFNDHRLYASQYRRFARTLAGCTLE